VKGTTVGALTDANGKFSITVPTSATTLIFSYIGMKSKEVEIGGRSVIDGVLESDLVGLEEVVVTALGIPKEKKALGYSVQDVKGDDLTKAKETNVPVHRSQALPVQLVPHRGSLSGGYLP
jgi:hypothetical protein